MLSKQQAIAIVKQRLPTGKLGPSVEYEDVYLFQVELPNPGEEEMDPFYSVNKNTGEFQEFSVLTDGDIEEITDLFLNVDKREGG